MTAVLTLHAREAVMEDAAIQIAANDLSDTLNFGDFMPMRNS